jgi:hypothetical protein
MANNLDSAVELAKGGPVAARATIRPSREARSSGPPDA